MLLPGPLVTPRRRRALVAVTALAAVAGCTLGERAAAPPTGPVVPVVTSVVGTLPAPTTTTTQAPTTTEAPAATEPAPEPVTATPSARPTRSGGRVLVVADSVLLGARTQLPAAMPGAEVTVDAVENRMITALPTVLAAHGPGGFQAIAIHLCTNYSKGMGYGRAIAQAMATLEHVPRVVWVTCSEWSSGQPEANQAIRVAPARYANAVVADWAAVSGTPGYTYADGIHLRPEGAVAAAGVVAEAVG